MVSWTVAYPKSALTSTYTCLDENMKKYAQVVHNFKNISKSIAYHHQPEMCNQMTDSKGFLVSKEVCGPFNYIIMIT